MSERPILFSGPMVRAILAGRKTQTRRVVAPQNSTLGIPWPDDELASAFPQADNSKLMVPGPHETHHRLRPRIEVGDRLWVRETFCLESSREVGYYQPPYADGRPLRQVDDDDWGSHWEQPHYQATDPAPELSYEDHDGPTVKWQPSIHMPRWASRLTLEVTGVRVQRVRDISEEDAIAEGFSANDLITVKGNIGPFGCEMTGGAGSARRSFFNSFFALHTGRMPADANPWVWVIEFKPLPTTGDGTNHTAPGAARCHEA